MVRENKLVVHYDQKRDLFLIRLGIRAEVVSANFIRYQLGIAYTKKDGTYVNEETIAQSKKEARWFYSRAIAEAPETHRIEF